MAAYTITCVGTNGLEVPTRVLDCVRQNGFGLSVSSIINAGVPAGPCSMTFSVSGAVGTPAIDNMTGQLRGLFGVSSVVAV